MNKKNNKTGIEMRMAVLETKFEGLSKEIIEIRDNHLAGINQKLDSLTRMFQTRLPLWTSILITLLTSGCIGLLTLYLATINKI